MKITKHTEINPGSAPPYPFAGKIVLNSHTEREANSLALFVEYGLSSLIEEGVAVSVTFPEEGITIWVCADSKDKVDKVLNTIPTNFVCE